MDSSKLKIILVVVLAAFVAVYLGIAAATAQVEAVAWILGIGCVIGILALGRSVWLLIPFGLVLEGTVNALPGSPPVWALGTLVTLGIFTLRFAMHKKELYLKLDIIDLAIFLQVCVLAQAYIRNPSGLLILGGDTAGGKPYLNFGVAIVAFYCLSMVKTDKKMFKFAVISMVIAMLCDGFLGVFADFVPRLANLILPIYSNVNAGVAFSGQAASNDYSQFRASGAFGSLGYSLGLICFCMARPLYCITPIRPVLFITTSLALVAVLLSGFRSTLLYLFAIYVVSALVRRKYLDIVIVIVVGFFTLGGLMVSGQIQSLPFGAQRALSFLPVEVSAAAKADAETSSEWRFEMWRLALSSDRYIQNKLLGDGFALSAREMQAQIDAAQGFATGSYIDNMEGFLLRGSYHGFHVETIRFTGLVGLIAAIFAMIVFFWKSLKLIDHYRNRPLFPYVAFLCIPFLIYPFWALLVFGAYRNEFPQFLAMAGLLKMLDSLRRREILEEYNQSVNPTQLPPVVPSASRRVA